MRTPPIDVARAGRADVIQIAAGCALSPGQLARIRRRLAAVARYSRRPPQSARLTLRVGARSRVADRLYIADARIQVDGRLLVAHAVGPTPEKAASDACERVRRQLRDLVGARVARRNEPALIRRARVELGLTRPPPPVPRSKPPHTREIVASVAVPSEPESTMVAVAELMEHGAQFALFCHARTSEDVVVHVRSDDAVGLLHPPGSALSTEHDLVVPRPSRYPEPITVADARSEMDVLDHRFVYFIAAEDQRGKVLYVRRDGDYALVELE